MNYDNIMLCVEFITLVLYYNYYTVNFYLRFIFCYDTRENNFFVGRSLQKRTTRYRTLLLL